MPDPKPRHLASCQLVGERETSFVGRLETPRLKTRENVELEWQGFSDTGAQGHSGDAEIAEK